jgi:hypothetical protein
MDGPPPAAFDQNDSVATNGPEIGARAAASAPKWPGGRFDLVWVFDRQDGRDMELHAGAAAPSAG